MWQCTYVMCTNGIALPSYYADVDVLRPIFGFVSPPVSNQVSMSTKLMQPNELCFFFLLMRGALLLFYFLSSADQTMQQLMRHLQQMLAGTQQNLQRQAAIKEHMRQLAQAMAARMQG